MKNEVIMISDLHMGEGILSPREDFFYDKEFSELLEHYKDCELVINGDLIDFLQIVDTPDNFDPSQTEKIYGLNTEPKKSAWKVSQAIKNHKLFYESLAKFAKKNKIHIVYGNHDIDFYWPEVRKRFISELSSIAGKNISGSIKFYNWFIYEPKRFYIEHGQQYDSVNSFCNLLYPVLPFLKDQLELPLGSFYCRYLFNVLETKDPYADNIKPPTKYLFWMMRHKPQLILRVLFQYFPMVFKTWNKSRILTHKKEHIREVQRKHYSAMSKLSQKTKIPFDILMKIDDLHLPTVLESRHFLWRSFKEHFMREPVYLRAAEKIRKLLDVETVFFGHTHQAEEHEHYINTGTWTPIIKDKKILDEQTSKQLNYAYIKGKKAELREWE
ncbi:MAG: metallophosphoesterase [Nanoarchaeota archaeon]